MIKARLPLLGILAVQAVLLFPNLDLLPLWTDELFTVHVVPRGLGEIAQAVRADIHPPLYYFLLHLWPWGTVAGLRAFSALWALLTTVLVGTLWTRDWIPVTLVALSPCLLLYGRMARSYSMQTALAVAAVYFGLAFLRRERRAFLPAVLLTLALLYTHYVPGIAVLAGMGVAALAARRVRAMLSLYGLVLIGYVPWLMSFAGALDRWREAPMFASKYALTGSAATETVLKAGFAAVSLTVGESIFPLSLALVPVILWAALVGLRDRWHKDRLPVLLGASAALIGYLGVARWVSYPFVPARLLWLLPFLLLAVTVARIRWITGAMLLSYTASIVFYFAGLFYLNKGYQAPVREIAARILDGVSPRDLVLVDTYNTDSQVLAYYLAGRVANIPLESVDLARARQARRIWVVRNQHDISPAGASARLEKQVCEGRPTERTPLRPLDGWQRVLLIALVPDPPTHLYQLTRCGP